MRDGCCGVRPAMRAGWRYDPSYQASDYTFSNLDLTTMTNISSGDNRLWVHLISCWVISLFVWRVRRTPRCLPSLHVIQGVHTAGSIERFFHAG